MAKEKHENCDCIFCTSKCPECDSINIGVTYKPVFKYENGDKNRISISRMEDEVDLECNDCGVMLEANMYKTDSRLNAIITAVDRILQLPSGVDVDINKNGKIEITPYESTVSRPISN